MHALRRAAPAAPCGGGPVQRPALRLCVRVTAMSRLGSARCLSPGAAACGCSLPDCALHVLRREGATVVRCPRHHRARSRICAGLQAGARWTGGERLRVWWSCIVPAGRACRCLGMSPSACPPHQAARRLPPQQTGRRLQIEAGAAGAGPLLLWAALGRRCSAQQRRRNQVRKHTDTDAVPPHQLASQLSATSNCRQFLTSRRCWSPHHTPASCQLPAAPATHPSPSTHARPYTRRHTCSALNGECKRDSPSAIHSARLALPPRASAGWPSAGLLLTVCSSVTQTSLRPKESSPHGSTPPPARPIAMHGRRPPAR
jgi:hypothetical protein